MDPDQITAAAADGVQHDDLGDATTYADGGGTDESWGRALLRRGWDLSRKAAIAGVAATAAPVVVPQLLVLSVAGLALSLPFAAYLASFAATERLMGALLPPPPRAQPYHAWDWDLDEDEFLDASEAPSGEAHVFEYWREAEGEGIVEEDKDESYPSLPLSREPRLFEEPVPPLSDDEGALSEGGFRFQELGHESNVLDSRVHKEEDDEYITMEALPRQGIDDLRSVAAELSEEVDSVPRIEEALVAADEPVQELSASDSGDKTEDGKRTGMPEMEFSKEMVSPGIDVGTTEVSDFPVPILDKDGITEVREGECEGLDGKSAQESLVSDAREKTEEMLSLASEKTEMPPQEVNVSESSVPDDNTLQSKIEDVAVEMALEEVISNTNPVTEEVVDVQMDVLATEPPECEPLHPSDLVAPELQAMAEAAYVDDVLESSLTEDVVMDIGDVSTDVTSVFSVATADDVVDLPCSTSTPNVSTVSDDTMYVESRPDVDHSKQTTGVECKLANKGFRKKELVEDKSAKTEESNSMDGMVQTRSMAPQDIDVSTSPVPDDQCKREDEVAVEMVLEEVTSATDLVTGEVVGMQVDIIASGSDLLPLSDPATVDSIQGSAVRGDIVTDIDDTENVEHHSEGGASSFISGSSVVTMDEAEDVMSSRIKPYVSAISEDTMSVEGNPDVGQSHKTTDFEHKLTNEGLKKKVVTEDKDNYTEEQLREQLDTLRTITGYRSVTSLTLEADLAGLYVFVGVEPPVSSRDASDLTEINMKLQFLKSIIGVE